MNRRRFIQHTALAAFSTVFPRTGLTSIRLPLLQHASPYNDTVNLSQYLVSEKLDGVRAYWNGKQFISRSGNYIHTPKWFTRDFPNLPLDGELWTKRNDFHSVVSALTDSVNTDVWDQMTFMAFDLPDTPKPFEERLPLLEKLSDRTNSAYFKVVDQFEVSSERALKTILQNLSKNGAEGLMLRRKESLYIPGRNQDLLKLKQHEDAEARVLEHLPGKGKYTNMMGALLVSSEDGKRFKIGSGFTDAERSNPPPIGSRITYKYYGFTHKGTPRFATFLRVYNEL